MSFYVVPILPVTTSYFRLIRGFELRQNSNFMNNNNNNNELQKLLGRLNSPIRL